MREWQFIWHFCKPTEGKNDVVKLEAGGCFVLHAFVARRGSARANGERTALHFQGAHTSHAAGPEPWHRGPALLRDTVEPHGAECGPFVSSRASRSQCTRRYGRDGTAPGHGTDHRYRHSGQVLLRSVRS